MIKNFAAQPENGGGMVVLTGFDLTAGINPNANRFAWVSPFNNDCGFGCGGSGSVKKNASGGLIDILKVGAQTYSSTQKSKADAAAAKSAAEIAQMQYLAEVQKTQQQQSKSKYIVPVAIAGAVAISGIAAYLIFKKKK